MARMALRQARRKTRRGRRCACALSAVASLVVYVIHLKETMQPPPVRAPGSAGPVVGAIQFLTVGPGVIDSKLWPLTAVLLIIATGLALWRLYRVDARDRQHASPPPGSGCSCSPCSAWRRASASRSHMSPWACVVDRYVTLAAMLVLAIYLIGVRYGRAITNRRLRLGCVVVLLLLTVRYDHHGLRAAGDLHVKIARLEEAVREGLPPEAVAARCCWDMQDPENQLVEHLKLLRRAGLALSRCPRVHTSGKSPCRSPVHFPTPSRPAAGPRWARERT